MSEIETLVKDTTELLVFGPTRDPGRPLRELGESFFGDSEEDLAEHDASQRAIREGETAEDQLAANELARARQRDLQASFAAQANRSTGTSKATNTTQKTAATSTGATSRKLAANALSKLGDTGDFLGL